MSKIILAKTAGYCHGVRRAVRLAFEAEGRGYVTLGPIIHNRHVVKALSDKGVGMIRSLDELPAGCGVIIRSHGVPAEVYDQLEKRGIPYIDATCPNVRSIHKIALEETGKGRTLVIIGDGGHPEVIAISSYCAKSRIFKSREELEVWIRQNPCVRDKALSVVSQTTNTQELWNDCVEILKKECTNLQIFDTMCGAACKRQAEAKEISKNSDFMVIIGDPGSSNTGKLLEICTLHCRSVILAESSEDLPQFGDMGDITVGITAGASTPEWIIKEVFDKMSDEILNGVSISEDEQAAAPSADQEIESETSEVSETPAESETSQAGETPDESEASQAGETPDESEASAAHEEDFATMLESSIKTLNTGDKVTGVVTAITPTEVYVDLGTKHAGYISIDQISDDPNVKPEDIFKIGDEVECYTIRVNDVEGTAQLSKKRLDAVKNWNDVESAYESGAIVEGVVTEENKGGIVVSVRGIRVFVPASQTGVPKGGDMSELIKKTVKLRITEVNRARRRVVGSIRAVEFEVRRAAAEEIWNEIEVGKTYMGTVKSLTSYGAFVDIGGVDGMVHVSELSWSRVHNPADIVSIGQKVEVNVLSFDAEKKKISLGYPGRGKDPWKQFTDSYAVDNVLDAKVVKLMPFGAFAEVIPGVDGLIHISQIADRRIVKPDDVLTVGETVRVKITDIDNERKKISLSIRALLGGQDHDEREPQDEEPAESGE